MDNQRFDLEKAIAAWRVFQVQRRVLLPEDLDELESHIREHTAHLVAEGMSGEKAFKDALKGLGSSAEGVQEYGKVYWHKLQYREQLGAELSWRFSIFKNYLKVALRTLKKQKGYTFINVFGLAAGLAVCIVIALFVRHELSYDRFHPDADQIYRVVAHEQSLPTASPLAPALAQEFSDVAHAVRVSPRYGEVLLTQGNESRYESRFYFVDSTFFDVFGYELLAGDPQTALVQPFSVVLTESMAARYFGQQNPIGETLSIKGSWDPHDYKVTGVVADPPSNTHFKFNFLSSYTTRRQVEPRPEHMDSWYYIGDLTYLKLIDSADIEDLSAQMPAFYLRHHSDRHAGKDESEFPNAYTFQSIASIHFGSHLQREFEANSDIRYVYVFSTVALLILLIACINFVNLTTARSAGRAREVGLRKVAGADRKQLVHQHLMESGLLTFAALLLALPMVLILLPVTNEIIGTNLTLDGQGVWQPFLAILIGGILISVLAGLYPAFYLTRVEPTQVLKGLVGRQATNTWFHNGLVTVQFVVSAVLIVGAFGIQKQLDFLQDKRLGLNPEQVILIATHNALGRQFEPFKTSILNYPGIVDVTAVGSPLPAREEELTRHWLERPSMEERPPSSAGISVGQDFLKTMEIPLLSGRNFFPEDFVRGLEFTPVIVNEAAVKEFGWEEPVGEMFECCFNPKPKVVGVMQDFHYQSLREEIGPLTIMPTWWSRNVLVRVQTSDLQQTLANIEKEWQVAAPGYPFEFTFMDAQFEQVYGSEERLARIFMLFSGLAVFIACLGLFGLAAHGTERRTREIGVRKVLGATASNIVVMLTKDLTRLVLLATVIATPIAFIIMERWLEAFAYRITLSPGIFMLTAGLALFIAIFAVSFQAIKAAHRNPVDSIRYE